jgi:hypothetical protein
MNRVRDTLALLSIALMLPSTLVHGQAAPTPVSVTLTGGAVLPMGTIDDIYNAGFSVAGGVEFTPATLPFGLRGELGYSRLSADTYRIPDGEGGELAIKPKWNTLAVTLNAILGPTVPSTQIRPYAIAGVGFYNSSEGFRVSSGGFGLSASRSKGSVGFNGGAGVRFAFVGFSSFIEARYHHVLKAEMEGMDFEDPDAPITWRSAGYLPISFGISFGGR